MWKSTGFNDLFIAIEGKMIQLKHTGTGQDAVRWPAQLAGSLVYLAGAVSVADFPPTDQHLEVHQILKERLQDSKSELSGFLETSLKEFLGLLEEQGVGVIMLE